MAFVSSLQKLLNVLDELESLKPEAQRLVNKLNEAQAVSQLPQLECLEGTSYGLGTPSLEWPPVNNNSLGINIRQVLNAPLILWDWFCWSSFWSLIRLGCKALKMICHNLVVSPCNISSLFEVCWKTIKILN